MSSCLQVLGPSLHWNKPSCGPFGPQFLHPVLPWPWWLVSAPVPAVPREATIPLAAQLLCHAPQERLRRLLPSLWHPNGTLWCWERGKSVWSEDSSRAPRSERGSWGVNKKQSLEQVGMGWDGMNEG